MATSLASVHEADDLNTCVICFEKYNSHDRLPKYLQCLHTFCFSCLQKITETLDMSISCPACRNVTVLGRTLGLTNLRTNEHAIRVIELEDKIANSKKSVPKFPVWCYTCDELATSTCRASHVTTKIGNSENAGLPLNQLNKIRLNLSYVLSRRKQIDSYLKIVAQSLIVLQKHITHLTEENALQIQSIEGLLQDLEFNIQKRHAFSDAVRWESVDYDSECPFPIASSFAKSFEAAKDLLLSVKIENTNGKDMNVPSLLNKVNMRFVSHVDDKAVNAAGLNAMSFILLLLMENSKINDNKSTAVTASSSSNTIPITTVNSGSSYLSRPTIVTPSIFAALFQEPVEFCYVDVQLYNEPVQRLIFEVNLHESPEYSRAFLRGFDSNTANYRRSTLVKAAKSIFVVIGCLDRGRSPLGFSNDMAYNRSWITHRGDVGLYCSNTQRNEIWDFIILLTPYSDRNVRRAPLVARLIEGLDYCSRLSNLKIHERDEVQIVRCGKLT